MKVIKKLSSLILAVLMTGSVFTAQAAENYTVNDTYEDGAVQTIPFVNATWNQLKPQGVSKAPEVIKQSNAAQVYYPTINAGDISGANVIRFNIGSYLSNDSTKADIIEFDIYMHKLADFRVAVRNSGWGDAGATMHISDKGRILNPLSFTADQYDNWWFDSFTGGTDFTAKQWHTVTMVLDRTTGQHHLYIDGTLVGSRTPDTGILGNGMLEITNFAAMKKDEALFMLDNFKIGSASGIEADADKSTIDCLENISYTVNDTYEDGTVQTIPFVNATWNQLKPQGTSKSPEIIKQSNAAQVYYPTLNAGDVSGSGVLRFNIGSYLSNDATKTDFIEFDIYMHKAADVSFSLLSNWGNKAQAHITDTGYILNPVSHQTSEYNNWWFDTFASSYPNSVKEFSVRQWHNIKMVLDRPESKHHLYLDGELVASRELTSGLGSDLFEIANYAAMTNGEALFMLDNFKVGTKVSENTGVSLVDATGNKVTSFKVTDALSVKYTVNEKNETEIKPIITYAFYEADGTLIDVNGDIVTVAANGEVTDTLSIQSIPADTKTIKAYLWSGTENITPLCENAVATLAVQ